ncbi:MAG: M20 family metallopeptidase [Erysipelotrichaceae bacterium]
MDEKILQLRQTLHNNAELAFQERKTKAIISAFLNENTDFEVVDCGSYMYACKINKGNPIAFRCDMDAVCDNDNKPAHLCGHDGHCAIICGLAKRLSNCQTNRDIYLIFQPAEEIGQGGKICSQIIKEKQIKEIYGLHNIPNYPKGTILLRKGCFACGSVGLRISYFGKAVHAAYPENGINPTLAFGQLINELQRLQQNLKSEDEVLMHSYIGLKVGSDHFGVNASEGYLNITVRAQNQNKFEIFLKQITQLADSIALQHQLQCKIASFDYFCATVNDDSCVEKVQKQCQKLNMPYTYLTEPMRWSEDFGYYLKEGKGCFFGIGDGLDYPQLHSKLYDFPDEIILPAIDLFSSLV